MSGDLLPVMPRQADMTVNDLVDNRAEESPASRSSS